MVPVDKKMIFRKFQLNRSWFTRTAGGPKFQKIAIFGQKVDIFRFSGRAVTRKNNYDLSCESLYYCLLKSVEYFLSLL